ncbi:hypothetical protein LJ737_13550 [Hymenobacter sp. 15J16-1T3B]|uniref:hypothetical protein n=1 Tax=Hymenobacter sp. 15J16-1T3B TaxID=2886941 RepID=UPI001D103463|nr:hypothetical protein [Hymenobacter sp. 15J16-1T3B]MCC3158268.1 hypothetical protein [Hymenobacter sp. 15J16-1T3B]
MNKGIWPYVVVKDLSIAVLYFVMMKYNLTNETYSETTRSNFPGAPEMDPVAMVVAALYITWLPMLADALLLMGLRRVRALNPATIAARFGLGMALHVPMAALVLVAVAAHWVTPNAAARISLALSFLVAGLAWVVVSAGRRGAAE